ncbi:hypothetical protein [Nocardioides sp.]|uniref:hypothetical protein n=1 Tax=Nocardioides sp. TaxID=35761 RepID=UPI003517C477
MPSTIDPSRPWPIVGRAPERAAVVAALASGSRVVTVHGPVGIGRARFLRDRGAPRTATDAARYRVLGLAGSAVLVDLPYSGVEPLLGDLAGGAEDPGAGADAALVARATRRLADLPDEGEVVVVVDDLALLDPDSLRLLMRLTALGRIRVVGALADHHRTPEVLEQALDAGRDRRVVLAPLPPAEVAHVVRGHLGGRVSDRAARALHAHTGGTPLTLRETVTAALHSGALASYSGVWQLAGPLEPTASTRDLVLRRRRALDPVTCDLLDRVVVCEDLSLRHLPGWPEVRDRLTVLEEEGWVEVRDGRVRPRLRAWADALLADLPALHVERLRSAQADLLEAEELAPQDVLRAALWRISTTGERAHPDPDLLRRGLAIAREREDHDAILRLSAAGLRDDPGAAELVAPRADTLVRLGRVQQALDLLDTLDPAGVPAAWAADLKRSRVVAHRGLSGPEAGLAAYAEDDLETPVLAYERAAMLASIGRVEESEDVIRDAVLTGDPERDAAVQAQGKVVSLALEGRYADALACSALAESYARSARVPGLSPLEIVYARACAHFLAGRLAVARDLAADALATALRTHEGPSVAGSST